MNTFFMTLTMLPLIYFGLYAVTDGKIFKSITKAPVTLVGGLGLFVLTLLGALIGFTFWLVVVVFAIAAVCACPWLLLLLFI